MQTDPLFEEEQHHLSETYTELQSMARNLRAKMQKNSQDAAQDKLAMNDELSPNFASYSDAMETYADIASVNRVIDAYNLSQSIDAEKLEKIQMLLKQPYFAKVVLQFNPEEDLKELYIGTVGVSDESYRCMVVDWRSAVAEVYYNQENGPTSYKANGRIIEVDLQLRRQFDIEADTLKAYFDTRVAIQDSLLLSSLSKRRTAHMQAITTTIQKEQNLIIRHEDVPSLLVNGIAGSGKTSVLLQRIAYLFYQQRESLEPQEVFLVTPNPVFQHYIDNVLPELGERNPACQTWEEFLQGLMPPDRSAGSADVPLESFARIDAVCDGVFLQEQDFKEIRHGDERLISANQIRQVEAKFKKISSMPHRVTLMREELLKRLDGRLAQIAKSEKVLDEISALSPNEQVSIFHETFDPQDEEGIRELARKYVNYRYGDAFKAVENDDWLRIDRIGMRLLGVTNLIPVEWVYLKMTLTGLGNSKVKYVMVDEVQDYTPAQLAVLARYFNRAHFMLLGDENQAISPTTASFEEVRSLFDRMRGPLEECKLMTSYRSTSEITKMFASLLPKDERMRISSIQRTDIDPIICEYAKEEEHEKALRLALEQAAENDGLTAVIFPHRNLAKQVQKKLGHFAPPLIDSAAVLPETGIFFVPLKLAKGLEFDHVIVVDASDRVFPDDDLSRRRLYTTISRATRSIVILALGRLTSLLNTYSGT